MAARPTPSSPEIVKMPSSSIPAKVFLLGEYAVLSGAPALVAAIGPRFSLGPVSTGAVSTRNASDDFFLRNSIHPESPAGRLLASVSSPELDGLAFEDPFHGQGGFGASTALFALIYKKLGKSLGWDLSWQAVWKRYRELTTSAQPPSGADLVAQWTGGVCGFDPSTLTVENLSSAFDWKKIIVFSATHQTGRKVRTHEHLAELGRGDRSEMSASRQELTQKLSHIIQDARVAIGSCDPESLGLAFTRYAETLCKWDLEIASTTQDRRHLAAISGVLGVKGAGALQSDAIIALVSDRCDRNQVVAEATARGLKLVTSALIPDVGVSDV